MSMTQHSVSDKNNSKVTKRATLTHISQMLNGIINYLLLYAQVYATKPKLFMLSHHKNVKCRLNCMKIRCIE